MHLSGVVLLLTFVVPPLWMVDTAYATPPGDPSADAPFVLLIVVPLTCAGFHVLVQIPAGLLGTWLGRNHTALVKYGIAVAVASVLSLLLFGSLGRSAGDGVLPAWADVMARGSIGLAGYMWVMRTRPRSVRRTGAPVTFLRRFFFRAGPRTGPRTGRTAGPAGPGRRRGCG